DKPKYKWDEEWFENVPIDHFSNKINNKTFKLRYLINTEYFKRKDAPIFFCLGGQYSIEYHPSDFGFLWDTASEFGAALIFAEHRYFGHTKPFGNDSFSNVSNLIYLSPEQAIADFVLLIGYLKEKRLVNANNSPVITFGGSYGGELNAWMRLKYPKVTAGAIASSAPIHYYLNVPNLIQSSYYDIIMRTYSHYGCTMEMFNKSFDAIRKLSNTSEGRQFLNKNYHLSPLSQINSLYDAQQLIDTFTSLMEDASEWNYNEPVRPAFPANISCQAFTSAKTFEDFALAPYNTINLFYNSTGDETDFQLWNFTDDSSTSGINAWYWLTCTKIIHVLCSRGPPYDVFNKTCPYNMNDDLDFCLPYLSSIGYTKDYYQPNWVTDNFGYDFKTATNLVFTYGIYDPWTGGAWRQYPTNLGSVYSYITDGGHVYDIRENRPTDTNNIKFIRFREKMHIASWIHQAKFNSNTTDEQEFN
ncbi:hypothetical protein Mgra_00005550, partial [Meloidogyne graminicola]